MGRSNQDCAGPQPCILGVVVGEWKGGLNVKLGTHSKAL